MSIFETEMGEHFATYDVGLRVRDRLIGGTPRSARMIEGWLVKNMGITQEQELRRLVLQTLADGADTDVKALRDLLDSQEDIGEQHYQAALKVAESEAGLTKTNGFRRNGHGLYLESRCVKAMLKENFNIVFANQKAKTLGWGDDTHHAKGVINYVAERVFVDPGQIVLGRDEPDETLQIIGHPNVGGEKRSVMSYAEAVSEVELAFTVRVLDDEIKPKQWARMWVSAQENGLAAARSQGFGRFDVTRFERRKP